jgi:hypothetical protein
LNVRRSRATPRPRSPLRRGGHGRGLNRLRREQPADERQREEHRGGSGHGGALLALFFLGGELGIGLGLLVGQARGGLGGFGGAALVFLGGLALGTVEQEHALDRQDIDQQNIPQRTQTRHDFRRRCALPGVRPSHNGTNKPALAQRVKRLIADKCTAARTAHCLHRHRQAIIAHRQDNVGDRGIAHRQFGRQFDGGPAHGDVDRRAIDHVARGKVNRHRQFSAHADGLAGLAGFPRHRHGGGQDDQAEQRPGHVQRQGIELHVEQVLEEHALADRQHDAEHDRGHADQVRLDDGPVEERAIEQVALVGHVELALARVEPGHHRGRHQVERQDGFIDLAPERAAFTGLRTLGSDLRAEQVRRGIGKDQRGRGRDDVLAEDQVGQRAGQEADARQRKLKVQHGIEVAQPLLPLQAGAEQRILDAQDLRHPARPADALADVQHQALGSQARRRRALI